MDADMLRLSLTLKSSNQNGNQGCCTYMAGAPTSTSAFYKAKQAFWAFTTIETTNAISLVITPISSPQWVYWSLIWSHLTTKISTSIIIIKIPIFSNWPSWLYGFFLLENMYLWLKSKGLSDNGYFLNNQFD